MIKKTKLALLVASIIIILYVPVFASSDNQISYDYGAADIRRECIVNTNPDTYTSGTSIQLTAPSCEGFEFKGWFLEPDYKTQITEIPASISDNITVYAKWYEMSYNISYVLTTEGIPVSASEITNQNTSVRRASEEIFLYAPVYISDTFTFEGWYLDSDYTQRIELISAYTCSDLTLYAHWVNSEFKIHYELGAVSSGTYPVNNPNPESYTYLSPCILSDAQTNDPAYTFEGWYTDEFFTEKITEIESGTRGEITLYANWLKTEYAVNYILADNSGINASDIENSNSTVRTAESDFILEDPITNDKSYKFVGWYTSDDYNEESKITEIKAGIAENITLYAKWETAVYKINYNYGEIDTHQCTVSNNNPTSYEFGDTFILNSAEANGFIFNGWCTDEQLKNPVAEITADMYGDITLYADFTEKTYTINYIIENKEVTESQVVNTSQTVRTTTERVFLDDAQTINVDYKFGGWYYDAEFKNEATFVKAYTTENVTVYAKWVKIVSYLPVWGDATLSEHLSAADARLILRYSSGLETSFTDTQLRISDINNDSLVNAADARLALRLSAGLENKDKIAETYGLPEIQLEDGEVVFK